MKMNDTARLYQVSEWTDPEDLILSQWGTVRFTVWCALEVRRWANKGRHAQVCYQNGKAALFGYGKPAFIETDYDRYN